MTLKSDESNLSKNLSFIMFDLTFITFLTFRKGGENTIRAVWDLVVTLFLSICL